MSSPNTTKTGKQKPRKIKGPEQLAKWDHITTLQNLAYWMLIFVQLATGNSIQDIKHGLHNRAVGMRNSEATNSRSLWLADFGAAVSL